MSTASAPAPAPAPTRTSTHEEATHRHRSLRYMEQGCPLTVRQGLEEYYTQIEGLITEDNAPAEVAALFRFHDLVHVVFGCDTSIAGETMADTWALSGTDVGIRAYSKYLELPETRAIVAGLGTWSGLRQVIAALPLMPRVLWRAFRMRARWPFRDNAHYLDRPLCDVRRELGIRVLRA